MVLANNIRYLRKKRGWSQDYLAERLGYKSYTTIQKWESGVSEPPLKKAHAIADLFGVDINDLTGTSIEEEEANLVTNDRLSKEIMAKNIKRLMALNHVNATDVCTALGFKAPTFSDWVNAKTYPRIAKIEAMSNYFGVSKADLVEEHQEVTLMKLYENIKLRRKELNLSQDELARLTGYTDRTSISKIESGKVDLPQSKIRIFAKALHTTVGELMGTTESSLPSDAILYAPTGMVPVLGRIPAGIPASAEEHIEGYEPVDVSDPENYYWLHVEGDSMINAGIQFGDLVLMRAQNYAENGQIVACRVNGDEATLKRFREQGDSIILLPENPAYEPRIVSKKDFADGYAGIVGVAIEIKRKL